MPIKEREDMVEIAAVTYFVGRLGEPTIETNLLDVSDGRQIVSRTVSYKRGIPETKYGFLEREIPWDESNLSKPIGDPGDYKTAYCEPEQLSNTVYVVKKPTTSHEKNELTTILRTQFEINDVIDFL